MPAAIEYPIRVAAHAAPAPGEPQDADLVIGVVVGREARAYPLNLLWDEAAHTVNDELGQAPIAVALCPLAGIGTAFSRRSGRGTLELGHVSEVERDTLVLYDAATHSRWGLLSGQAFRGPLTGARLERLPTLQTTWGHWKALHPDTSVYVAPDQAQKGFELNDARIRRVVLAGAGTPRRADWVVGLSGRGSSAAVIVRGIAKQRVANERFEGQPIVVFLTADLTTAVVWRREAGGRTLTFSAEGDRLVDAETGTSWDALAGKALSGPLAGRSLSAVPVLTGFWHSWQAHHPDTQVMGLPAPD
jgi:hypothetical protein